MIEVRTLDELAGAIRFAGSGFAIAPSRHRPHVRGRVRSVGRNPGERRGEVIEGPPDVSLR